MAALRFAVALSVSALAVMLVGCSSAPSPEPCPEAFSAKYGWPVSAEPLPLPSVLEAGETFCADSFDTSDGVGQFVLFEGHVANAVFAQLEAEGMIPEPLGRGEEGQVVSDDFEAIVMEWPVDDMTNAPQKIVDLGAATSVLITTR